MTDELDHRLVDAYEEVALLDEEGLNGLCPSYTELTQADTRYRDSELLGRGAVKEVYKTFNNHTRRWVAMARLRADRGPEFYDLFVHEAWLTASLSHPNIITVHDAGVDSDGRPFFTMDLKGNSSLEDRVKGPKASSRRELLDIFMKVCDAVAYGHSQGVVHLDLKPENIQANAFGEVLVCDWGLAKLIGATEEGENILPAALRPLDNMTLMGQIKGSLGFMAPEQTVPGAIKDQRSDIFALGCILHFILTGHPPFEGSEEEVLEATRKSEFIFPRMRYPDLHIPEALEAVVLKAMAGLPEERYASVQALRDEIFNFLGGYSTLAEKPGFFREAYLFLRRNWIPATITFLGVIILTVESVLFVQGIDHQRERAAQFETEAETVTTLYKDELGRSEQERKVLAVKLALSASDLKKLGIYVRPVETVREARKLIDSSFALNSEGTTAQMQSFSLDCTTLNFKSAVDNQPNPQSGLADYLLFVEAFPYFDFTEEKRPTVGQLTEFLQQAREINPDRQALMERIVAYDFAAREDKDAYVPVIESLLEYVNTKKGDIVLQQDLATSTLIVRADRNIHFVGWDKEWGSNECLLRFLSFRTLKLVVTDRCYLGDLQSLQIETLDLSECETVVINRPVDLPLIRRVFIRSGQINKNTLRNSIRSNEPFVIIEKDSQ